VGQPPHSHLMEPGRAIRPTGGRWFGVRCHTQRALGQTQRGVAFRQSGDYPERGVQSTQGGTHGGRHRPGRRRGPLRHIATPRGSNSSRNSRLMTCVPLRLAHPTDRRRPGIRRDLPIPGRTTRLAAVPQGGRRVSLRHSGTCELHLSLNAFRLSTSGRMRDPIHVPHCGDRRDRDSGVPARETWGPNRELTTRRAVMLDRCRQAVSNGGQVPIRAEDRRGSLGIGSPPSAIPPRSSLASGWLAIERRHGPGGTGSRCG
jgi:hypothetical protein